MLPLSLQEITSSVLGSSTNWYVFVRNGAGTDLCAISPHIDSKVAKHRMKKWHDQLISNKEFQKGQRVLLYDTRLHIFPGKLKSRWIGPFIIHQVYVNGVVELLNSNGKDTFRVNGYRLKPFMEPFKPEKEEINLLEP